MNKNISYEITPENAKELIDEAITRAYNVNVDQLGGQDSIYRRPTNKTISEILELALNQNSKTLWNFIYRDQSFVNAPDYWDVGCRIIGEIDYFLWIQLTPKEGSKLAKKYKLKRVTL